MNVIKQKKLSHYNVKAMILQENEIIELANKHVTFYYTSYYIKTNPCDISGQSLLCWLISQGNAVKV